MPKKKPADIRPGEWVVAGNAYRKVDSVTHRLTGGASGGQPVTEVSSQSVAIKPDPDGTIEVLPGGPPDIHCVWMPELQQWSVSIDTIPCGDATPALEVSMDGGVLWDSEIHAVGAQVSR